MQRKLTAIMAADVVGYSRLMRADETGTLAAMKALWSEVVQPSIGAHRGRVFKLMGDGMLAEFASVVDAANAAEAIQTAANERASDQPEDKAIRLRIGINLGDVVVDGSDLYGDGVNVAARLQEVAAPGGIAVSAATHEYIRGKSTIIFADAGARELKNIDQPVPVWLWPSAGGAAAAPTAIPSRSSLPSIAVLPFQNLSSAEDAEFFADGMTEDVINALSKFRWLFVIARGTMFTYQGKNAGAAEVARDLGVRYVVEGSVRQAGQRIRVSVQLVDTETANPLWTERFDRQLDDIFAIQDEITNAIAASIAPEIETVERLRAEKTSTTDIDAWLVYQKALTAFHDVAEESVVQSIDLFDQAAKLDPKFALAFAMGAIARLVLGGIHRTDDLAELTEAARQNVENALVADPKEPLAMMANARLLSGIGDLDAAILEARRAIAANPNNAMARRRIIHTMLTAGKFEEAVEQADVLLTFSPFDPGEPMVHGLAAFGLYCMQEYQRSLERVQLARRSPRINPFIKSILPANLLHLARKPEALKEMQQILEAHPNFSISLVQKGTANYHPDAFEPFIRDLRELGVPEE